MTLSEFIAFVVSLALIVYLVVALLFPERF